MICNITLGKGTDPSETFHSYKKLNTLQPEHGTKFAIKSACHFWKIFPVLGIRALNHVSQGWGNYFTITGRINCGLSLAGRK